MNMNILVAQSLEQASKITGKGFKDKETQEVAFKLSCAAIAQEKLAKEGGNFGERKGERL